MTKWLQKTIDRFWSRVDKSAGPNACWPWTAVRSEKGYGLFRVGTISGHPEGPSRTIRAHRFAHEISSGSELGELQVLHRCDNPPCCNPMHLVAGTNSENRADSIRKGRDAHSRGTFVPKAGMDSPSSKLTDCDVIAIRAAKGKQSTRLIAERFGIGREHVWSIQSGRAWKHLPWDDQSVRQPAIGDTGGS